VSRTAFAELPQRVEYELTEAAYGLLPVFRALLSWSTQYRSRDRSSARSAQAQ